MREPTLYKYGLLLRQLQDFAQENGLVFVLDFNLERTRRFRETWNNRNVAARKKLEALRTFFRFAHNSEWITTNPASKLRPPKITEIPTIPFTREQVQSILDACSKYPDKANAVRVRAFVLLLRYSGLRIMDAATLARDRIKRDRLLLYTAKTGTPVYCPLPPVVIAALAKIPQNGQHYFWTGESKRKSIVGIWERTLKRLFTLAEIPDAHAHRFRHTFAVELLLAGVPLERVAVLLGPSR